MIYLDNFKIDLIKNHDTFIFDCDGVLWTGSKKINNADKVIKKIIEMKKQVLFLTNSSTKTTDTLIKKFNSFKIPINKKNLIHAGLAASFFINNLNLKPKSNIYIIGSENLHKTLKDNTNDLIFHGLEDNNKTLNTFSKNKNEIELLKSEIKKNKYSAVVVGWDNQFNTYKLAKACAILKYQKKCKFISTNNDYATPFSEDLIMPANGSIVSSIELSSGIKSICVGKPSKELGINIIKKFKLNPQKTIMIGDRIDSDLYFGKNNSFKTCIVLSGVTNLEMIMKLDYKNKPDFYASNIESLIK